MCSAVYVFLGCQLSFIAGELLISGCLPYEPAPMSRVMATYGDFLEAVYDNLIMPPDPKGGSTLSNKYIDLAVIKKEEVNLDVADGFAKAALSSGIDEIMNRKESIELEDIFKPERGQTAVKFVFLEGVVAVGKSVLAWQLCRRWREIEAMTVFSAVVYLGLHSKDVHEAKSLVDLLYHDSPTIQQAVSEEITSSGGEKILFILDGFGEVPASLQKSFFLAKVISGECLPKASVLVTSRPSASAVLLSLRKPDKHLEVLGFTQKLLDDYASSCSILGSIPDLIAGFRKYIPIHPAIESMMYIPLNSVIAAEVYFDNQEDDRPIPQTSTEVYSELTLTILWRFFTELRDEVALILPRRLAQLPEEEPEMHDQLLLLAKIAFEGTLNCEIFFEKPPADNDTLGMITTSQHLCLSGSSQPKYVFFDLTMQEFLASYYLSYLTAEEQQKAFRQYSDAEKFPHMDAVWKFLAGLTGFRGVGWELVQSERGREEHGSVTPFLLHCLYEAEKMVDVKSVLGESRVRCTSPNSLLECFVIGYCIATSRCTWEVDFGSSGLGAEVCEYLAYGLRSQDEVCGSIDRLDLSCNSIGQEGMAHLRKFPDSLFQQLSHLEVHQCRLDGSALGLLAETIPAMTHLELLDIGGNPAGDGGTAKLLQSLATASRLHTLNMVGLPIACDDIMPFSYLVRPSGSLKELAIGHSGMQRVCVELLLKTVLSPTSLEHLALWGVDLTALSFAPMEDNHTLATLKLYQCTLGSEDLAFIAAIVQGNTTLKSLHVGDGDCHVPVHIQSSASQTEDALRVLSQALKVNRSLKLLSLHLSSYSALGREGVRALVGALLYNQTLEHLKLPGHCRENFSRDELSAMDTRVEMSRY